MTDAFLGEIRIFAGDFAPEGWALCDGRSLQIGGNEALYSLIGTAYGASGVSFNLPDLRGRVPVGVGAPLSGPSYSPGAQGGAESVALTETQLPVHTHLPKASTKGDQASPARGFWGESGVDLYGPPTSALVDMDQSALPKGLADPDNVDPDKINAVGGGLAHDNLMPFLTINFMIATSGEYPTADSSVGDPFLGQVLLCALPQASAFPSQWMPCDGRQLPVKEHQALYSIIANNFGGDGTKTFNLPDMRGAVPVAANGTPYLVGTRGGEASHTLTIGEMPPHTHNVSTAAAASGKLTPASASWAESNTLHPYSSSTDVTMNELAISGGGGFASHENRQPYAALQYLIAVTGNYPPTADHD